MAALLHHRVLLDDLVAMYAPYRDSHAGLLAGPGHVDDNVFGIVPLELARQTRDAELLAEGLRIADHQRARIDAHKRFAIDDMFMITVLQVQAWRASGNPDYLDTAAAALLRQCCPAGFLTRHPRAGGKPARLFSLPFKGGAGVGMVFRVGMPAAGKRLAGSTPSPPNPPLEGEGFGVTTYPGKTPARKQVRSLADQRQALVPLAWIAACPEFLRTAVRLREDDE